MGRVLPASPPPERNESWPRLSTVQAERIACDCSVCARRGFYRVSTLAADFGDPAVDDLPMLVAQRARCMHAVLPPRPGVDSDRGQSGVRFAEAIRPTGGGPGGSHSLSNTFVSVEESTKHQVELNRIARETSPLERQRHEKLRADLAKIRDKKGKRRARTLTTSVNPR